jgi:glycosyltransferase involved in cell wall biosynthesis
MRFNMMPDVTSAAVDLVLPVHNEAALIAQTLEELDEVVRIQHGVALRMLVCEDGSTDNTVAIVEELAEKRPILLMSSHVRKGYSRAAIDGLRSATSPIVGFMDSDGQCDPVEIPAMIDELERCDMVVGYRNPRHDPVYRKAMSASFKVVYERLFPVRLRDPSYGFMIMHRSKLDRVLRGNPGMTTQGFWWEFNARALHAGLVVHELPVHHRFRAAGKTQVYRPERVPGIAAHELRAMVDLRRELRTLSR